MRGTAEDVDFGDERALLGLAEKNGDALGSFGWVTSLVRLGWAARRYLTRLQTQQLVVVLSVPRRDFAAVLLGCGWVVSAPAPPVSAPTAVLGAIESGMPVRAVTVEYTFVDLFQALVATPHGSEARFKQSQWLTDHLVAVSAIDFLPTAARGRTPTIGGLTQWAGVAGTWYARLASPDPDLAFIGAAARIRADMDARLAPSTTAKGVAATASGVDIISNVVLPRGLLEPTHFSEIYSSARLADELPLPSNIRAAILDGYGAIKYLQEIESPVVFCVVDRSVADEKTAELLVQYRNSHGEPVSLTSELQWSSPIGVEALAFTTRL